ncbi:hypothetical protein SAMN02910327_01087 [Peptostreptococcaceae bacterium pGA-8]|nr:hypothetical protein SAMN02910327_01087 [Peptostreptococcaceae bacterium pGA-8]
MIERINSISSYLKKEFGEKTVKLSIDGGFTCPNRDGSKGFGGCVFCSEAGSGDTASTIEEQKKLLSKKWPKAKYLAYFQNFTNTYAPVSILREKFEAVIEDESISGLVIGTRPDCLPEDVLDLLSELNEKTFLWVELGLQTIHEDSADFINRCYPLEVYDSACRNLKKRNIRFVTHLILGLPSESKAQMLDSVKYVCESGTWGIKLHLLNIIKGSQLAKTHPCYKPFETLDEYVNLVCDILEYIPDDIIIHRLTADAPRPILISPPWSYRKRSILNGINQEMRKRDSYQGCRYKRI